MTSKTPCPFRISPSGITPQGLGIANASPAAARWSQCSTAKLKTMMPTTKSANRLVIQPTQPPRSVLLDQLASKLISAWMELRLVFKN